MEKDVQQDLALKAQGGDKEAIGALYDEFLPVVYRRVCTLVPLLDAEDVTQEIFISMVRSISNFRGDALFSTWLYNIVHRRVADYYRRNAEKLDQPEIDENIASDQTTIGLDNVLLLKQILNRLSYQQREIILLRIVDGLSFKEIAQKLEIELGAAKLRFYRAISSCKEKAAELQLNDVTFSAT